MRDLAARLHDLVFDGTCLCSRGGGCYARHRKTPWVQRAARKAAGPDLIPCHGDAVQGGPDGFFEKAWKRAPSARSEARLDPELEGYGLRQGDAAIVRQCRRDQA